jgi:hypothetical protein
MLVVRWIGSWLPGGTFQKPDSGHAGTISIAVRVRCAKWNAMKPRIQCALTQ